MDSNGQPLAEVMNNTTAKRYLLLESFKRSTSHIDMHEQRLSLAVFQAKLSIKIVLSEKGKRNQKAKAALPFKKSDRCYEVVA